MRGIKVKKDRKTKEVNPKKSKRILCVVLKENHGVVWRWVSPKKTGFRLDENVYFLTPEGVYLSENKVLTSVYLEGISTPLAHKNVEKEVKSVSVTDLNGHKHNQNITLIKGLKWDSNVIDMLLNRHLADEFTRIAFDVPMILLLILVVGSLAVGIVNIAIGVA